jgi:hypothetical protein
MSLDDNEYSYFLENDQTRKDYLYSLQDRDQNYENEEENEEYNDNFYFPTEWFYGKRTPKSNRINRKTSRINRKTSRKTSRLNRKSNRKSSRLNRKIK